MLVLLRSVLDRPILSQFYVKGVWGDWVYFFAFVKGLWLLLLWSREISTVLAVKEIFMQRLVQRTATRFLDVWSNSVNTCSITILQLLYCFRHFLGCWSLILLVIEESYQLQFPLCYEACARFLKYTASMIFSLWGLLNRAKDCFLLLRAMPL